MPVGRLVGEFDIADVLEARPEELWASTCHGSGISKSFFDSYFDGRSRAYALQIGNVRAFEVPIAPSEIFANFTPPQSFMYVRSDPAKAVAEHQLSLL